MNLGYQVKRYKYKPVGSIELQTAKYLGQLAMAFTGGDDLIAFFYCGLGTSPSLPYTEWSWQKALKLSRVLCPVGGRALWHILIHALISILGFGHNKSLEHFFTVFFPSPVGRASGREGPEGRRRM